MYIDRVNISLALGSPSLIKACIASSPYSGSTRYELNGTTYNVAEMETGPFNDLYI
jgi:hypothetical protein